MTAPSNRHRPARLAACVALAASLAAGAPAARAGAEGPPDDEAAAKSEVKPKGFLYREIPVDRGTAPTGDGAQVTIIGNPVVLHGERVRVGEKLRAATLRDPALETVEIAGQGGRVRILSIVPSLKTKTCEQQTHYLSEKSGDLDEQVELVTISLDSPKTQGRFARDAGIENVTFLSDESAADFGRAHGLLIEQPRMLARAVIVVDADDVVRYVQVVPEVSHMPDMQAAFDFARKLVEQGSAG